MAAAKNPPRGESHYNHKLTDDDCRLVMALVEERAALLKKARDLTDAKIAEKFEVHPNTIWKISARAGRLDATMRDKQLPLCLHGGEIKTATSPSSPVVVRPS